MEKTKRIRKKIIEVSLPMTAWFRIYSPKIGEFTFHNFLKVNIGKESCAISRAEAESIRDFLSQEIKAANRTTITIHKPKAKR